VQTRVVTMADVAPMVDFLFLPDPEIDEGSWNKTMASEFAAPLLRDVVDAYGSVDFVAPELKSTLEVIAERHEQKLGKAQAPVRVAVTGRTVGPPLFESLEVMGRDETLRRLRGAVERLDAR
jgi:glutamyl-tRNA synthetase